VLRREQSEIGLELGRDRERLGGDGYLVKVDGCGDKRERREHEK